MSEVNVVILRPEMVAAVDAQEINRLVQELKPGSPELSLADVQCITHGSRFIVARTGDGVIVGMAILFICQKPTGTLGIGV